MELFKSVKHKEKPTHRILFTTDRVNGKTKEIHFSHAAAVLLSILLCVILGGIIGFAIYEEEIYSTFAARDVSQKKQIEALEFEKANLEIENESLQDKVTLLSDIVNQKVAAEEALKQETEQAKLPTAFPLTGSAQAEETDTITAIADMLFEATGAVIQHPGQEQEKGDPIVIFTATEGTTAVASGSGTVFLVDEDANYGHVVVIDHGNGYMSFYLNDGEPKVMEGMEVRQGDVLFVIGAENTTLGYQIKYDDAYVNPMEVIAING